MADLQHDLPDGLVERLTSMIRVGADPEYQTPHAPFTGQPLFRVPISTVEDVDDAFEAARAAQVSWAARPAAERAAFMGKIHDLALERQSELLDLLQLQGGKSRYDAWQEFVGVVLDARFVYRTAPKLLKDERRPGVIPLLTQAYVGHRPKGVVGVTSAWNYPAVFAAADGLTALAAGNTLVHRPDTQTALCAIWVRDLAMEAGIPEEVWQVVVGDGPIIGQAVAERADHVAFTGSTPVGRKIAAGVAERMAGMSMELGGKNPFVVLADAPLDRAVEALIRCSYINAGQTCVGPERVIVDDSVYDEFREKLVRRVQSMTIGVGLTYDYEMGCLVSQKQLDAVAAHVDDAVANGATVLAGGRKRPDIGPLFYEPTLLENVVPGMNVCTQETFGPVLSLYRVKGQEEAVVAANDTDMGLHAVVWTGKPKAALDLCKRIKAGTVEVNDGIIATWGSSAVPQGGMKLSGFGRRHGAEGITRYTEAQSITLQRVHGIHPPGSLGHEAFGALMARSLKVLHLLGRA